MDINIRRMGLWFIPTIVIWVWFIPSLSFLDCVKTLFFTGVLWTVYLIAIAVCRKSVSMALTGIVWAIVLCAGLRLLYLIGLMPAANW